MTQVWPFFNPHGLLSRPRLSNCLLMGRFSYRNTVPRAAVLWSVHSYLGSKSRSYGSKLLLHSYRWPQQGTQIQARVNSWRVRSVSIHQVSKNVACMKKWNFIWSMMSMSQHCNFLLSRYCNFLLICFLRRHENKKKLTDRQTNKSWKSGKRKKTRDYFWESANRCQSYGEIATAFNFKSHDTMQHLR